MEIKLGFKGLTENKDDAVRNMQNHIQQDELIKNVYVDPHSDTASGFSGCSVACIAYKSFEGSAVRHWTGDLFVDGLTPSPAEIGGILYAMVDKILNIEGVGPIIDVIHEATSLDDNFNINLLMAIKVDVNYAGFVNAYMGALIQRSRYTRPLPTERYYIDKLLYSVFKDTNDFHVDFLSFLNDWNTTHVAVLA